MGDFFRVGDLRFHVSQIISANYEAGGGVILRLVTGPLALDPEQGKEVREWIESRLVNPPAPRAVVKPKER